MRLGSCSREQIACWARPVGVRGLGVGSMWSNRCVLGMKVCVVEERPSLRLQWRPGVLQDGMD